MKYLIVGLGNIGREYEATRHNIGFRIADALSERMGTRFETKRYGDVATGRIKNAQLVLLKPSTYMNLSGEAVRYWMSTERITIDHVLVLVDDLALPFGTLRLKSKGSDAGHPQGAQIDYVLGRFSSDEEAELPRLVEHAVDASVAFCLEGISSAMNKFNATAP